MATSAVGESPTRVRDKPKAEDKPKAPDRAKLREASAVRTETADPLKKGDATDGKDRIAATRKADTKPAGGDKTKVDGVKKADRVDAAEAAVTAKADALRTPAGDRVEATKVDDKKAADAVTGTPKLDLLARAPDKAVEPGLSADKLKEPVQLAQGPNSDFEKVDAYAKKLAEAAPPANYVQSTYTKGITDALSGKVPELGTLSDPERTRLLDAGYKRLYSASEPAGNSFAGQLLHQSKGAAKQVVADDMAQRAIALSQRAKNPAPGLSPMERDKPVARAQFLATRAGLANASKPKEFLERLGPDAGKFAEALNVDRPGRQLPEATKVVARTFYKAAETASAGVRDSFQSTMVSKATGRPQDPTAAARWDKLATLNPDALGQSDLRQASQILNQSPPINRGADILGADHPAVQASAALTKNQGRLRERLKQENAVYKAAGFSDDAAYPADDPAARSTYLKGVSERVDTLSPRAADQALQVLKQQKADGVTQPNAAQLQQQLEKRLMISSGVDLATRVDQEMKTALADRGLVGRAWDGVRNGLGLDSGSEAVNAHLKNLQSARDDLKALESFKGSNADLSTELATRLDKLQKVAQTTSKAVGSFIEQQDGLATRGLGLLQAVGGGFEVAGGIGLMATPEPITTVAGAGLAAMGADDVQAGTRKLLSGSNVQTFRAQLARNAALAAGASPGTADGVATAADLSPAGVALARGVYKQAHRVFGTGPGTTKLAGQAPLKDNFIDQMAKPRGAANAVRGKPFKGPEAQRAIRELEAQGVKVIQNGDDLLDSVVNAGKGKGPLGAFNHRTGEIILRGNPTKYEWAHESAHAKQWLAMGKDAYQKQTMLQREAHVYKQLAANSAQFNRKELRHAQNYIQRLTDAEAKKMVISGYTSKNEVLGALRAQGVPESILRRVPVELFGHRPRRR